jgi:hypothetical protein
MVAMALPRQLGLGAMSMLSHIAGSAAESCCDDTIEAI